MSIHTFVKDVNDFGKKPIQNNLYEYEQHSPRPNVGDTLIYFYPNENKLGIYTVTKELEFYKDREDFTYCRGEMLRCERTPEQVIDDLKKTHLGFAMELQKTIIDLLKKYQIK